MDDPETWRWVWLAVAVTGLAGEIVTAGTFFLLPFGLGGALACIVAFAGGSIAVQWIAFVAMSLVAVAATRPLVRHLDRNVGTDGIGARRWIGRDAIVLTDIPGGVEQTGTVRVGAEQWRAQSRSGRPLHAGDHVVVVEVTGTRLVVEVPEQGAVR